MLDSGPAGFHGVVNQVRPDNGAAFHIQNAVVRERASGRGIADDQAAEAPVPDKDIRTQSQYKVRQIQLAGHTKSFREIFGPGGFEVRVRGTADAKCGVGSEDMIPENPSAAQSGIQFTQYVWIDNGHGSKF